MTSHDYFGDWMEVIDDVQLERIMHWLNTVDRKKLCPFYKNIFRAFRECPYKDCNVVILGQDPYSQPGVATGILFGNKLETPDRLISPSLKVIMEAVGATENFDKSLLSWVKQGVLMLNSALTYNEYFVGSHVELWRPFMAKLIQNLSHKRPDIVFMMFGSQAQYFTKYLEGNPVITEKHPAYYARMGFSMPRTSFEEVNNLLEQQGKPKIIYT